MNETYMKFALSLAQECGGIIKDNFLTHSRACWKKDNTPVTEVDLKVNELASRRVRENFPEHNFIGEEGDCVYTQSPYTWVCDPIDGTIPYSHGIPVSTFSLALVKDGKSVLGVIYDPFLERMFYAAQGGGAFLNTERIRVCDKKSLAQSLVGVGYKEGRLGSSSKLLDELRRAGAKCIDLCSFAYTGALVASGQLVAAVYTGIYAHDVASVKVIVEEAGGVASNLLGEEERCDREVNGLLVTNGSVHETLLEYIKL